MTAEERKQYVREWFAAFLFTLKTGIYWEDASKQDEEDSLRDAVRLLAIADKQGNSLIAVLSEDQTLPLSPSHGVRGFREGITVTQQDMLKAGFKRVIL